jgi:putative spermidine/putrescine transport system permease protein
MATSDITSPARRLGRALYMRPRLRLAVLLGLPVLWLVGIYGGSLASLLLNSFFSIDPFGGTIDRSFTFETWRQVFTDANMAVAVTVGSLAIGFPLAYYTARYTRGRLKTVLILAILVPLWSSYLVRVYAWKLLLAAEGVIAWGFDQVGLGGILEGVLDLPIVGGPSLSTSLLGQFTVFTYIWLPYMVLPIQAAVERVPRSLLEASADLGASAATTFRQVTWPLVLPGVAAGSIFTFSLTLGDYIIPTVIGDSSPFIGLAIYSQQGVAGNLPLAAALAFIPVLVMVLYLSGARKLGAFEAL